VQNCRKRVNVVRAIHSFVMQGTKDLFLTYLPMFNWGSYRQQLILSVKLPSEIMEAYVRAQRENPEAVFTLHTSSEELLSSILQKRSCVVDIHQGLPKLHGVSGDLNSFSRSRVELTEITVVKYTKLAPSALADNYPPVMPFFLYGSSKEQHIEHVLLKNDNVQLNCSRVELDFGPSTERILNEIGSSTAFVLTFDDLRERAMQPFGGGHKPDFFAPSRTFQVSLHMDPCASQGLDAVDMHQLFDHLRLESPVAQGTITLGESAYVDFAHLNRDTVPQLCITPTEQLTRDQLLSSVKNDYQKIVDNISRVVANENTTIAPDIEEHILARATLPSKYSLGRFGDAQNGPAIDSKVHVSRFTVPHPSDDHSRQMMVRTGWKDMFDETVANCRSRCADSQA